jgi:hypothetical protein
MSGSKRRCSLFAGLLATLSLLASGCGGSKPPSVASLGTTTSSKGASTTSTSGGAVGPGSPPSQTQVQGDALAFARCMRASGVPSFPDPKAGGGFVFQTGAGVDPSAPAFKTAQAKCRKLLPSGGLAPGTSTHPAPQWLAHMVKVAQCMRRHGISGFPDPRTSVPSNPFPAGSPGGVISDIQGVILVFPAAIDTQSPLFTRAAAACGFPLHNH